MEAIVDIMVFLGAAAFLYIIHTVGTEIVHLFSRKKFRRQYKKTNWPYNHKEYGLFAIFSGSAEGGFESHLETLSYFVVGFALLAAFLFLLSWMRKRQLGMKSCGGKFDCGDCYVMLREYVEEDIFPDSCCPKPDYCGECELHWERKRKDGMNVFEGEFRVGGKFVGKLKEGTIATPPKSSE